MADSTGRFTQSGPFRALLSEFAVEDIGGKGEGVPNLILTHIECGLDVCAIEDDDTMDVLVQTVIEHDCNEC